MYYYWIAIVLALLLIYYLQNTYKEEIYPLDPLETERLKLRIWKKEDVEDLYEYAKNPLVGPSAGWSPHGSLDESLKIIQGFMDEKDVYAIELKATGKVIGSIGLHLKYPDEHLKKLKQREIGYVLNPDYWGNGYMPEAVEAVKKYCLESLELDLIWCGHFIDNSKSKRVIEKSGFKYRFTKDTILPRMNNQRVKTLFYAIEKNNHTIDKG